MSRLGAQAKAFQSFTGAAYEDRCTIRRKISAKSGLDTTYSTSVIASNVPCRIRPASASERELAAATEAATSYAVRMPFWQGLSPVSLDSTCSLDIAPRDRIADYTLHVIAPLPSSGTVIDTVAVKQS